MTFTHHPIPALGELLKKGDQLNEIGDPKGGAPGGDVSEDVRRLSVRKCGGNGGQCSVRCAITRSSPQCGERLTKSNVCPQGG
jgi:hypothetical protein